MEIVKGQAWKIWEGMEVLFVFWSMGIQFQHKSFSRLILAFCIVFEQEKGKDWSTEKSFCWATFTPAEMPGKVGPTKCLSALCKPTETWWIWVERPGKRENIWLGLHPTTSIALNLLVCKTRFETATTPRLLQGRRSVNIMPNAPRYFQRFSSPFEMWRELQSLFYHDWSIIYAMAGSLWMSQNDRNWFWDWVL